MDSFFQQWKKNTKYLVAKKNFEELLEEEYLEKEFAAKNGMESVYWCEACRIGICDRKH